MFVLEVKKVKRSWGIYAGKSLLGKFKTEELARNKLISNRSFYEYWAGSCSVSVENTKPIIINC